MWNRLEVIQDLTYTYDDSHVRRVIPEALRHQVAAHLHAGHQGLDSMTHRARPTVYWPGMEADLQYHRTSCRECERHAPPQPLEPLVLTPPPEFPFQQAVMDLFHLDGHTYLAYADRVTGWLEVAHIPGSVTSGAIIARLLVFLRRWGSPKEIDSDGGTNLDNEEMRAFFKKWGVTARTSSAHFLQSNGCTEAAAKAAKRVLRGNIGAGGSLHNSKATQAMLQYFNILLREGDISPAQLAAGRQLRDGVPV